MHETPNTPKTLNAATDAAERIAGAPHAALATPELFDVATDACAHCQGTGTVLDAKSAGILVRDYREARKVTRAALADALGFSSAYLADLETGRRAWARDLFTRIVVTVEAVARTQERA